MRTVSAPDALLYAPLQAVDLQRVAARWAAGVVGVCGLAALLPFTVLPNAVPLVVVFGAGVATLLARNPARPFHFDAVTPISVLFAAVGFVYVAASLLQLLPAGNQRPLRADFIPRHSYFVFLWLPLMAGTAALFRHVLPDLQRLARAAALPMLVLLAVVDVVSAALLGAPQRIEWEGYTSFLDPPALTFLYALCFFFAVATRGRIVVPLAVATLHCAVSNVANYGMMFNSMTGMFVFACLWGFALASRRSPRLALWSVVALGGALVLGLVVGPLLPELTGFDLNTHWRFLVWHENLLAALESGSIGVGFGTPYYELTTGNLDTAYRLTHFAEFSQYGVGSPVDILYIRGQHSSLVNAFYRMGLAGGGLLIAFNVAVLVVLIKAVRRGAARWQPVVAAAGAMFIVETSQTAMHVGIESPRYFAAYALAVGLARAAAWRARRGDHA